MRSLILYLICFITLIISCKKADLQEYIAGDGIYFYTIDSTNYSFANQVGILNHDTVFLAMRILGPIQNYDREIQLKAVAGTTAQANTHYSLPPAIVKANTNTIMYPVILFNTADLKENTVRLELEVIENSNFPIGAGITSNGSHFTRFKINFNNKLIKPTYWDSTLQAHFGTYSNVKYKFIIDTLGKSDFSTGYSYSDFLTLKGSMSKALREYEAINGPLIDENKNVVTFPI